MLWLFLAQLAGGDRPAVSATLRLVPPPCAASTAGEIVVCQQRAATDRFGPRLPDAAAPILPDAEFRLFGSVRAGLKGEQVSVGGVSVPAAKVTVRVPF